MIYEFALEPELVATWADRQVGRYFIEKFGLGEPRLVSRYPKRWKKLVWDAFTSDDELARTRMTELLSRLSEKMVKRRTVLWESDADWLQNAENEHGRVPFHVILARVNPRGHSAVLIAEEVGDATERWNAPRGISVARTAASMSIAVAAMLRVAEVVVLVDPHFGPENLRHRRPLEAFIKAALDGRPCGVAPRLVFHSSVDNGRTQKFFEDTSRDRLPRCIPRGLRLALIRLRQKGGGEQLHNRYILTELGGVMFGVGLDEGAQGDTDDILLLDREQYEARWRQYVDDESAFERPEPTITIEGTE